MISFSENILVLRIIIITMISRETSSLDLTLPTAFHKTLFEKVVQFLEHILRRNIFIDILLNKGLRSTFNELIFLKIKVFFSYSFILFLEFLMLIVQFFNIF